MGKSKGRGSQTTKSERRVDDLRDLRGDVPSASTRHSSTTFKPAPKILKCKEIIRENKGQTQTRTKIGKRVAVINERMGAISKRIGLRNGRKGAMVDEQILLKILRVPCGLPQGKRLVRIVPLYFTYRVYMCSGI